MAEGALTRLRRGRIATLVLVAAMAMACGPASCVRERIEAEVASLDEDLTAPAVDCDTTTPGPSPQGCLSGRLHCGDRIASTTIGGESNLGRAFYAGAFCFPAVDGHEGPERAFLLQAPPKKDITITLESDCVDLDIAAVAWSYEGTCPTENHPIPECEASNARGGGVLRLNTFQSRDYLILVDGKDGAEGPFRLKVDCTELVR